MKLKVLALKDRPIFDRYLKNYSGNLSKYSFAGIFIDKALFEVLWVKMEKCLCVFAKQKHSFYMLIPPLGKFNKTIAEECFKIMDKHNSDKKISRIENVSEEAKKILQGYGFQAKERFGDYLYMRKALAGLKGNKYKSKRANCNFFTKHYKFNVEEFSSKHISGCLELYKSWMAQKRGSCADSVYQGMLEDGFAMQKLAMKNFRILKLEGLVIKINSEICAYSLGYKLNKRVFCILSEVADLGKKGIAQYIFKHFCEQRKEIMINAMDDSGIESLKKTKLSYHPLKLAAAFAVFNNANAN